MKLTIEQLDLVLKALRSYRAELGVDLCGDERDDWSYMEIARIEALMATVSRPRGAV